MCDVLGWEHHVVYNRPEPLPSADILQDRLQYIYPRVDSLIKNITRFVTVFIFMTSLKWVFLS
jgi:hypothetical protein